ncbi:MAG: 3-deoxy-D-manno-octulosonic acid transferase [Paracoccaceae bacterium]
MSPLLRLYLAASHLTGPLWRLNHRRRLKRGKEVAARLPEKYGTYPVTPHGKPVLWFHALSVGESFALLPVVDLALERLPEAEVVLTTSTASSVEALAKANLPERCHHILLPIDTPAATRAFLDHWRPDVAAFAELDFWPRLMVETARRDIPMVLVNSRLPDRNFERRQRLGGMIRDVVQLFDTLLVQDDLSRDRFVLLGAAPERIEVVGALKAAARPLATDESALTELRAAIGPRPVWCAAATEASEHAAMIEAHKQVSDQLEVPLLIVAPRFREDGADCEALARETFTEVARRSAGEPLRADTQVYVADTFGEMGLWYRLAPVSFIGHSLTTGLEGKNPFEGAALGSALLTGPHVSYFSESFQALYTHDACVEVTDATSLAEAVVALQDAEKRATMIRGAEAVIAARSAVLTRTWAAINAQLAAS